MFKRVENDHIQRWSKEQTSQSCSKLFKGRNCSHFESLSPGRHLRSVVSQKVSEVVLRIKMKKLERKVQVPHPTPDHMIRPLKRGDGHVGCSIFGPFIPVSYYG